MDPFEVRMQFTTLVSRQLTSSVSSISKVAAFALKHAAKCSDDIWDCFLDEIGAVSLNGRVNLLYLLDALLDKEGPKLVTRGVAGSVVGQGSYRALAERDLGKVVASVVPETREGVLNWMSTHQLLRSWRQRRLLDVTTLDHAIAELEERKNTLHSAASTSTASSLESFSRNDILRRIEDDRERQKRLKERLWVLPIPSTIYSLPLSTSIAAAAAQAGGSSLPKISPVSPASPFDPAAASSVPAHMRPPSATDRPSSAGSNSGAVGSSSGGPRGPEIALDIEFEQLWEANEEERKLAGHGEQEVSDAAGPQGESQDGRIPRPWPLSAAERATLRSERQRCFAVA
ncbi:hypothetical protein JCM10908_003918 [Rhodotorula pacifica]|uniref:uncharacterized protein n=1 Tax=Rhodotorula pacifica TaxID=1495444 RepID=UPI00316ED01F